MTEMTGDWKKAKDVFLKTPKAAEEVKDFLLHTGPTIYSDRIKGKIITNDVKPEDGFSAHELAQQVETKHDTAEETSVGIYKDTLLKGKDAGKFAVDAEYGLHGNKYMGIWRNTTEDYFREIREIVTKISKVI